jgi:hypothetical protein
VVVLLICLVLVVVAIVVVIRLLLAELARSAAYRQVTPRDHAFDYQRSVDPAEAKVPVSAVRAAARAPSGRTVERLPVEPGAPDGGPLYQDGGLLLEVPARPRTREVGRVTKVVWWRRLRSGTALVLLVALLGAATAALIGAIVLFFAFVLEQAIN